VRVVFVQPNFWNRVAPEAARRAIERGRRQPSRGHELLARLLHPPGVMPNRKSTLYPYWEAEEPSHSEPEDVALDYHRDVQLAPSVPESLVTWDVSGHAQCEKDRMNSAYRASGAIHRGY
jgi:hypothetical protein